MSLTPILLRQMGGRAGTTLVMQLLATSPLIAFDRVYPFERRYFLYFLNQVRAMAPREPRRERPSRRWQRLALNLADELRRRAAPSSLADTSAERKSLPRDPGIFELKTLMRLSLEHQWEAFSRAVIEKTAPPEPVYFAEKFGGSGLEEDLELESTRHLWLVRDPRDMWASINAFDDQRGYYGFGRRKDQSRESFLHDFTQRMQAYAHLESLRSDHGPLIRYEDLIEDLPGQTKRLEEWLSLELDWSGVSDRRPEMGHHMTSSNAQASIGRWKTDLPPEEQRALTSALADVLRQYGYEA